MMTSNDWRRGKKTKLYMSSRRKKQKGANILNWRKRSIIKVDDAEVTQTNLGEENMTKSELGSSEMASVILSEKGKKQLCIEGYKFSFQTMLKRNKKRWLCTSRKTLCKAYVITEGVDEIIIGSVLVHNHEKSAFNILNRQIFNNRVKRAAVEDLCERPMKIIGKEIEKCEDESLTSHDILRVRKNINHARSSILPSIKSTSDLPLANSDASFSNSSTKAIRNYIYWSNAQCLTLIEEYKNQPILWDSSHPSHYNIPKKRLAWQEICENLQADQVQAKQKITSLLGSFRRERSRERKTSLTNNPYKSKWYAYQPMQFLSSNDTSERECPEPMSETNITDEIQIEEKSMHDLLFEPFDNSIEIKIDPLNPTSPQSSIYENTISSIKSFERPSPEISNSNKKAKKQQQNIRIEDIHSVQSSSSSMNTFSNEEMTVNLKEECSTFGQHVANKLLKYNSRTRAFVEHAINNIIFEADIGKYDEQNPLIQFVDSPSIVSTSFQNIEPDTNSSSSNTACQNMDFIKVEPIDV